MKKTATIIVLFIFLLSPYRVMAGDGLNPAGTLLQQWFGSDSETDVLFDPRLDPRQALTRFYRYRNFQPAWIGDGGPLPQIQALLQIIHHAPVDGLRAMDYDFWNTETAAGRDALFTHDRERQKARDLASLDVALTEVMIRYAAHLSAGRVQPEELPPSLVENEKSALRDLPADLSEAIDENRLGSFIDGLSPRHGQYLALKKTLRRYRQIQADGGWPRISEGSKLKIGDTGDRVRLLHRHLKITGDLKADAWLPEDRFSAPLESAVKTFQRRHGLEADGIVGGRTLATLNLPIETRMIQLMLNMERWRWLPEDLGSLYVIVNIPSYELRVVENQTEALSMRAIVGREKRPTPVLFSQLTYMELNPYWNIPQKIARQDLLPKIQADPEYLERQGIQVFGSWQEDAPQLDPLEIDWSDLSNKYFPFRLRQEPDARNALGRIKFMFPNPQSVYIHDTPGKSLFNRARRLFSSGCVRVEDPLALAVQILKGQQWDRRRLQKVIDSTQNRTIVLQQAVPVYLVYFTAWTDEAGDIHFSEDIYDHDRRLLTNLLKESPSHKLCSIGQVRNRASVLIESSDHSKNNCYLHLKHQHTSGFF